jgi:hypothetical protein
VSYNLKFRINGVVLFWPKLWAFGLLNPSKAKTGEGKTDEGKNRRRNEQTEKFKTDETPLPPGDKRRQAESGDESITDGFRLKTKKWPT